MQRDLGTGAERSTVKLVCRRPPLQSEVLKQNAAVAKAASADRESSSPFRPLLAIEALQRGCGLGFELLLALGQIMLKGVGNRVSRIPQLGDPLHHDLNVPEFAQTAKEAAASLLHLFPAFVGIEGHKSVRHRTAATECDAQVVDRIGGEAFRSAVTLFQNALHPERETAVAWVAGRARSCGGGHSGRSSPRSNTHFPCFRRRRPVSRNRLRKKGLCVPE